MKKLKRFILSMLLTKQERVMIWNALWFSNHTYRRRGNVDGAAAVQMVMNRTEGLIVPKGRTFSEKEVTEIVDEVLHGAAKASEEFLSDIARREFRKGYKKGRSERVIEEIAEPLRPFSRPIHVEEKDGKLEVDMALNEGMEIDREKCETCDAREGCIIFAMIFGQDKEEDAAGDSDKATEGEDTEGGEKTEEQAPEGTEGHHEAPIEEEKKEDEGK